MKNANGLILILSVIIAIVSLPLNAQDETKSDSSRFGNRDEGVSGPSSVTTQMQKDAEMRKAHGLKQADEWLKTTIGFGLGGDYNIIMQQLSRSLGATDAAGGVIRIYGNCNPGFRNKNFTGRLIFKFEHRHLLGTELSPQMLGPTAGYAGITAATFSDKGFTLSNFYWTQSFFDNRFAFNAGVVDITE